MTRRIHIDDIAKRGDRDPDLDEIIGAADQWYHHLFGAVHTAGGGIARLFGGGALVDQVERLEDPILPDWAKGANKLAPDGAGLAMVQMSKGKAAQGAAPTALIPTSAPAPAQAPAAPAAQPTATATAPIPGGVVRVLDPEYVVAFSLDKSEPDVIRGGVAYVNVTGGKKHDGPGCAPGQDWTKGFSYGYELPVRVEVVTKAGTRTTLEKLRSVLFCAKQPPTKVSGEDERTDEMDFKALGDQVVNETLSETPTSETVLEVSESPYVVGSDFVGALQRTAKKVVVANKALKRTGAPPQRAGVALTRTPKGRVFTRTVVNPSKQKTVQQVVANAEQVGKRAVKTGNRILKQVATAAKKRGTKLKGDEILGSGYDVLGAVVRKTLSRNPRLAAAALKGRKRPPMTLAQIKNLAEGLVKTGKTLEKKGAGLKLSTEAFKKREKAGLEKAKEMLKPRPTGTNVRGDVVGDEGIYADEGWTEIVGALDAELTGVQSVLGLVRAEILGESDAPMDPDQWAAEQAMNDAAGPRSGDSGGSYGGSSYGSDSYADSYGGSSYGPGERAANLPGPEDNYGMGSPPTREDAMAAFLNENVTYVKERPGAEADPYRTLPKGAIKFVWDATTEAPPFKGIASYTTFHGRWKGKDPDGGIDSDGTGAGFEWHGDQGSKWWVFWPWSSVGSTGIRNASPVNPPNREEAENLDVMQAASLRHNWGPLIGNPKMEDWKGLRYLQGSKEFFWHRDVAPPWAIDAEVTELHNKMVTDYEAQLTAAKDAYTAAVALDALDAQQADEEARRRAKEDEADQRRREKEAEKLAEQAERQAIEQQKWEEQYMRDQAKFEQEMMRQQAQLQQQYAQAGLAEQQMMMQMMSQYPEMFFGGGGMAPGGYGGGGYADYGDGFVDEGLPSEDMVDWGESERGGAPYGGQVYADDLLEEGW